MKKTLMIVVSCFSMCFPRYTNAQGNTYFDDDSYEEWTPDTVYVPVHDTTYIYI
jgi:hypothetical protein